MRRFLLLALFGIAPALAAQAPGNTEARVAPQVMQYDIRAPINEKITEFAVPVYVRVPVTDAFSFDIGTSWASARVESTDSTGGTTVSQLSGATDTQIRANYVIGTDFIVLTAGVNLPTGQTNVGPQQLAAATRIASDFLLFPITGFGTGAGGTGGVAIARPLGLWNVGAGIAVRHSVAYNPFRNANGSEFHFRPGDEYRARVGVDRPYGTGRISLGVTYSMFGGDQVNGSVYNTGNRVISQASVTNSVGNVDVSVAGWDLFRASGELVDGTRTGHENIANAGVALGFHPAPRMVFEPSLEGRVWTQATLPASYMGTAGVRLDFEMGGYAVTPFAGYTFGQIGETAQNASLTGFRATLAIRLGGS